MWFYHNFGSFWKHYQCKYYGIMELHLSFLTLMLTYQFFVNTDVLFEFDDP